MLLQGESSQEELLGEWTTCSSLLVFVVAYQKMLNLHYLDELLDEIQLWWDKKDS
jgi:hypothetical protein